MIGRFWRGLTAPANAQAYEEYLRTQTLPALRRIDGYEGAYVLRRHAAEGVEFAVLTLWASIEAVKAFAGDDYETAVIPADARNLLAGFDEGALHYEVAIRPEG